MAKKASETKKAEAKSNLKKVKNEITTTALLGMTPEVQTDPNAIYDKPATKEEKLEVKKIDVAQPMVRVKPNRNMRPYIGDQYYDLVKGKVITVPANVKEILMRTNCLDPL